MSRVKIFDYFEIAARTAISKADKRAFLLGAVGIRKDGTMVKALNSPTEMPNRKVHAEWRCLRKMDYGGELYVARVRLDTFNFGVARPCHNCQQIITSRGIKKVYYTIDQDYYGIWMPSYPNKDFIRKFSEQVDLF